MIIRISKREGGKEKILINKIDCSWSGPKEKIHNMILKFTSLWNSALSLPESLCHLCVVN